MKFMQITNEPAFAKECQLAGIDRIMVDLESRGKALRQAQRDTLISGHSLRDVALIGEHLDDAELMVRINPWHDNSQREIDEVISLGAAIIMLPMFRTAHEVNHFISSVGGRSRTCLLLETSSAVARLDDILDCPGIDEVFVGLNDLHIEMKVDFMFELVSGGLVPLLARRFRDSGLTFGFGGVAPEGQGPISPRALLGEHVRLGSSRVILSRGFRRACESQGTDLRLGNLRREVTELRRIVERWQKADEASLRDNIDELREQVRGAQVAT